MRKEEEMNLAERFYPDAKTMPELERLFEDMVEIRSDLSELLYFVSADGNSTLPGLKLAGYTPVNIGGLSGFPFQGMSSLSFAPRDILNHESVLILYATDIDLNIWIGQDARDHFLARRESAINVALNKLMNNRILPDHLSELDYQMNFIEQILYRDQRRIRSADFPLIQAAEVMYEAVDNRIRLLLSKANYKCRYVILAGGIQLTDHKANESFFVFKRFDCIDTRSKAKIDWIRVGF